MRCEHMNQQNDWATARPHLRVMNWHEILINAPIGPPCQNKYFDYFFSGLEPPRAESPNKQPHVLDRWSLWFSEQWK